MGHIERSYENLSMEVVFPDDVDPSERDWGHGSFGYQPSSVITGSAIVIHLGIRTIMEEVDAALSYTISEEGNVILRVYTDDAGVRHYEGGTVHGARGKSISF